MATREGLSFQFCFQNITDTFVGKVTRFQEKSFLSFGLQEASPDESSRTIYCAAQIVAQVSKTRRIPDRSSKDRRRDECVLGELMMSSNLQSKKVGLRKAYEIIASGNVGHLEAYDSINFVHMEKFIAYKAG